jgi:methylenetetrahydrofolate dehydrogenase (NADP+)/methenyltetrahydrofolate cyclohydrolase
MIVLKASPLLHQTKDVLQECVLLLPRRPTLAVILVGHNPASLLYVEKKHNMASSLGFQFRLMQYDNDISESFLSHAILKLNNDANIDGILIQLPLPSHFDTHKIMSLIDPSKDVDGLHPINQGLLWTKAPVSRYLAPCTPLGILRLLTWYGVSLPKKRVLILGRSTLVGSPLAAMFLHSDAQVTVTHSQSPASRLLIEESDIIVMATGTRAALRWDDVKAHQIIIDVGTHQNADGTICGDLGSKPQNLIIAGYSPVPGGVGPMTVNSLMYNIFKSHCLRLSPSIWSEFIHAHHRLFEPLFK